MLFHLAFGSCWQLFQGRVDDPKAVVLVHFPPDPFAPTTRPAGKQIFVSWINILLFRPYPKAVSNSYREETEGTKCKLFVEIESMPSTDFFVGEA